MTRRETALGFLARVKATVQRDPEIAYRLLTSAVTVDPGFALGWFELGGACADLKLYPAAIAALKRALICPTAGLEGDLTADLKARTLVNLGHRLLNEGRIWQSRKTSISAIDFTDDATISEPRLLAFARLNIGLAMLAYGDTHMALVQARHAFELDQSPIIETGLAFAELFAGNLAEGFRHFEARFAYARQQFLDYPYPRWGGKWVGTLLVGTDHGCGDTLSFARFLPLAAARAGRVVFQVNPPLVGLLTFGMGDWPNIEVIPHDQNLPLADAWVPIMSLPHVLGLSTSEIRDAPQRWHFWGAQPRQPPHGWKSPAARLHVGIAYAGSPANDIDRWRSIPVTRFLDLLEVEGVALYSLQVGERAADVHAAGCSGMIRDLSPYIADATDTIGIMRELDLVVTIESFVGHIAGCVDKECWIPLSARGGDFRCGKSGDHPMWYPNTTLFRQELDDLDWSGTFGRIVEALRKKVARVDV
jgi:tetratricopeptide (TPR) repeat protein